jgi:hypothetical protein
MFQHGFGNLDIAGESCAVQWHSKIRIDRVDGSPIFANQQLRNVASPFQHCKMQRSSCSRAGCIRVCASVEQQLYRIFKTAKESVVQCCEAVLVAIVDICVKIEETPDADDLAFERSSQECEISWGGLQGVV